MGQQVGIRDGGFPLGAVDQIQQGGGFDQVPLVELEALEADAVGGVDGAVIIQKLLGVGVGLGGLGLGQLAPQFFEPLLHGGVEPQSLHGLFGHIVADQGGFAGFLVQGDGLLQKGFDVVIVLVGAGQLGGLLVGVELGQQVKPRSDFGLADRAHRVGGGDVTARQGQTERQHQSQRGKCFFHG